MFWKKVNKKIYGDGLCIYCGCETGDTINGDCFDICNKCGIKYKDVINAQNDTFRNKGEKEWN